jgi:hypothetical protein
MKSYLVTFAHYVWWFSGSTIGNVVVDVEDNHKVNSEWIESLEQRFKSEGFERAIVMNFVLLPDEE